MSKVAVIYWTGSGNTEIMANKIGEGLAAGGAEVTVSAVGDFSESAVKEYDKLAFGCPSMGAEELEDTEFEPFFTAIEGDLSGKKVALFGSYDWGDGEWMETWGEQVKNDGADLFKEGLIINLTPDDEGEEECFDYGKEFAAY